jgi:hypothetical protein
MSVTVIQQPAEVVCRGAQRRKLPPAKELFVFGSRPAMGLMPCHGSMMTQDAGKTISFAALSPAQFTGPFRNARLATE